MDLRNLSVLAYANGFTQWHYRADNNRIEDFIDTDFWQGAGDLLEPGHIIFVTSPNFCLQIAILQGKQNMHFAIIQSASIGEK